MGFGAKILQRYWDYMRLPLPGYNRHTELDPAQSHVDCVLEWDAYSWCILVAGVGVVDHFQSRYRASGDRICGYGTSERRLHIHG